MLNLPLTVDEAKHLLGVLRYHQGEIADATVNDDDCAQMYALNEALIKKLAG